MIEHELAPRWFIGLSVSRSIITPQTDIDQCHDREGDSDIAASIAGGIGADGQWRKYR